MLVFLITDGEEKLLYITDTYYCRYTFKDVNHIMVECNHSYEILNQRVDDGCLHEKRMERLIQSHFSLENVIKFLKSMDLTKCQDIRLRSFIRMKTLMQLCLSKLLKLPQVNM